jgi:hypothetical protein
MQRFFAILLVLIYLAAATSALAKSEDSFKTLTGSVTDHNLVNLAGVTIKLSGHDKPFHGIAITRCDGQFVLKHPICQSCDMEVFPSKGSSLATAWIDNIDGRDSRRIVVELQKGYEIEGRITHAGIGLKGLIVTINSLETKDRSQQLVHGRGKAITRNNGLFEMVLTPGLKCLTVTNDRYQNLADSFSIKVSVTADGVLPDIDLPDNSQELNQENSGSSK